MNNYFIPRGTGLHVYTYHGYFHQLAHMDWIIESKDVCYIDEESHQLIFKLPEVPGIHGCVAYVWELLCWIPR